MNLKQNKGFTLIELIMVIVILGILAAVVVPKFQDLQSSAHEETENGVIGNIKAGLMIYSTNKLAKGGKKQFPAPNVSNLLTEVLDEIPDGWAWDDASSATGTGAIIHTRSDGDVYYWSYSTTNNNKTYSLGSQSGSNPAN